MEPLKKRHCLMRRADLAPCLVVSYCPWQVLAPDGGLDADAAGPVASRVLYANLRKETVP
ncbi:hypothetical protein JAB1_19130 [Janthinobacterium sp. MP5059B]|nr:hypothetical protein JAB1_19130 [Janthinobacterium sp. MP5059B]